MPAISAVPFTTVPAVRILLNWADTPGATHATVFRIDCETGEEVQLRPYIAYNSDGYIRLSCGQAVIWDTEVPFDRCVRYCTRAQTSLGVLITAPAAPIVMDSFTRTLVDTWGNATETGQPWTNIGGTSATDYDVPGTIGTHTHTVVNSLHTSVLDTGHINQDIYADFMVAVGTATGGQMNQWVVGRFTDTSNYYTAILVLETTQNYSLIIAKRVAGSLVFLTQINNFARHEAGEWWRIRLQVWGNQIRTKAWLRTNPEPDWMLTTFDGSLITGTLGGFQSRLEVGNTNTLPQVFSFDNLLIFEPCPAPVTVQSCSDDLMVGSSGWNMLRDPLRPCNDVRVGVCWTPEPGCVPDRGVFFQRLEAEGYGANSQNHQAFNAARPTTASRERSDAASTLVLVSRTFEDRDAVLDVLRAGTPLLWQSPPEYGIPDRYIQVGDVSVARYNPDHRYQPRTFTLPFVTVDRPEGPAQGICGARVADLCDTYATWGAMATAGLSYQELLLGHASPAGPSDTGRRRWGDVEANFANWLAVETVPNTWKTLRDGS